MTRGGPAKLYEQFEPPERLTLLIEAMARDDEGEADRLQRTCPRATYTGRDPRFEGRCDMASDILAVMNIDLRCMWGKLHAPERVLDNTRATATAHNVTAALAFVDGERCGRGLKQCDFFARPLPSAEADDDAPDAADDVGDDGDDEGEGGDEEVWEPTAEQVERGRRMDAVQKRAEHFTACGVVSLLGAMDDIANDLVNTWSAFGRFCRTRLGVSPETMLRAWHFPFDDFYETVKRYEKVEPDPARVKEYTGYITKQWDRRFRPRRPGHEYVTFHDAEADGEGEGGDVDAE